MTEERPADVVVVGNGVVGLSIAYELARRAGHLRIVVCGPRHRSGAASAAAGAMLNTFGEITKYTLLSAAGEAKFQLCRDALDRWPAWIDELKLASGDVDMDRSLSHGTTVVYNAVSGTLDDQNFAALQAALTKYDEPYEEIDPRDVPSMRPVPRARPLRALHIPREGAIDARSVLSALESATAALGVRAEDREVTKVLTEGGRTTGVRLADGGTIAAGTVLVAAGSFSGKLLDVLPLGAVPLMLAGKGIAALTRRTTDGGFTGVVRTPTRSGACGLHVLPLGDGLEYVGATNALYDEPQTQADLGQSSFLLQCVYEQLDLRIYKSDIERWLVGNRPATVDGYPLIGRTSIEGLLFATGTYRDGFHCSPMIARLVADDLLGEGSLAESLPLFKPERAPIQTLSPDDAAEEFALQAVSGGFEDNMSLPPGYGDTSILDNHYRQFARRYYEHLDTPVGLGMDVLLTVVFDPDPAQNRITRYLNAARRYHGTAVPVG
ncbi:FAD-dependent oxidoreductase [Micromonospora sp. NPDC049523]|uniref:NAD(P)/FAD-dependent oxidoreductase n=1 Tax=Micromonospora sp. NPDC049523 TaxID=3155921 RepID=UPI003430E7B9